MIKITVFLLLSLSFPTICTAQTIENASFELPNIPAGEWRDTLNGPGWTHNATSGIASGVNAWGRGGHSGSQYAFIQSGNGIGMMTQRVMGLTIGYRYRISFWMERRDSPFKDMQPANVGAPIQVLADNDVILDFTTPSQKGGWQLYQTKPFIATASGISITFMAKKCFKDQASLIDDVVLFPLRGGTR